MNTCGLRLLGTDIQTFTIKDLQREYTTKDLPEHLQKVVDAVHAISTKPKEEDKITLPEKVNSVMIPEQMSMKLIEKWQKMTTFDRMLMFQKTPPEYVKEKEINKKGDVVSYVEGNIMIMEANIAFLFEWESKIDKVEIGDTAVCVYGSISVVIDGRRITRSCVGDQEINAKITKYLAVKGAHTDMIKKGLSSFGFNGDVYRGEV